MERLAEGLEGLEGLRGLSGFEGGQTAALNALKTDGRGGWLQGLLKGRLRRGVHGRTLDNVRAMVTKQVPHLRWSQAPPRPWRRPGSADIYIHTYTYIHIFIYIYIYIFIYLYIYI